MNSVNELRELGILRTIASYTFDVNELQLKLTAKVTDPENLAKLELFYRYPPCKCSQCTVHLSRVLQNARIYRIKDCCLRAFIKYNTGITTGAQDFKKYVEANMDRVVSLHEQPFDQWLTNETGANCMAYVEKCALKEHNLDLCPSCMFDLAEDFARSNSEVVFGGKFTPPNINVIKETKKRRKKKKKKKKST